jgi:NADH-quinone oxidoreductase subunit L
MVQLDIKRVLAYSTVSQLGYMFLACGVGAYAAGIFHLLTHAFFKALLFLAAGSVIHALSGEQDMRNMGGLRKRIPVTFWTMTMGVIAIAGIPPLAGFFSKDEILFQAFTSPNPIGKLLWFVGLVTAGMTSFYMFRLWFKTFWGEERFEEHHDTAHGDHHSHGVHESPLVMTLPLMVLALLSIIGGWVGVPAALGGHDEIGAFLEPVFANGSAAAEAVSHGLELGLAAISVLVALGGFFVAYLLYYKKPGTAASFAQKFPTLYRIVENKFYIDEIYQAAIVTPLLMFSRLILGTLVDGGLVNGSGFAAAASTRGLGSLVRRIQSGNIRSYAGWLALGAAAVIVVMIFGHSLWLH